MGYDLFTPVDFILRAKEQTTVFTDIAVCMPEGYYGQITSKSGLTVLHEIDIRAGVINPDYTGNIGVVVKNDSLRSFERSAGNPIAQLLFIKVATPFLVPVDTFEETTRGPRGFGYHDHAGTLV